MAWGPVTIPCALIPIVPPVIAPVALFLPARHGTQQEKPSEALYAELEARALGAARELVQRERSKQVADLLPLLDHMVKNRMEGRAYITGVDVTKIIAENAEMIRDNLLKTNP
ncbi:hypothetical protein [Altererythrobacter litoralis]|uniref:Uncharacterized protein n=1 Tax=Altererythrobacter litoralis TaxID=3113904 RepID=A0ABU7GAN6_9SPHN|nr:hypothetical protein [Erythrobacteraceae bacterium 1XM1-14]